MAGDCGPRSRTSSPSGKQTQPDNERRFRALFEQVAVGMGEIDAEGRFTAVNDRFCRIVGYSREELLEMDNPVERLTHPEDINETREHLGRMMRGDVDSHQIEKRYRRKDGQAVWVRVTTSAVRATAQQADRALCVIEEITEHKRAERRTAMEHAVSRVLARAEPAEEVLPEVLGETCQALEAEVGALWLSAESDPEMRCHSTHLRHRSAALERFRERSQAYRFGLGEGLPGRVWAGGEPAWIGELKDAPNFPRAALVAEAGLRSAVALPVRTGDEFVGVMEFLFAEPSEPDEALMQTMEAVGAELGQYLLRRRAERTIKAGEARKSAILESALDCIITMDAEGRVVDFNPAAERTFGYTRAKAVGRPLAELIIPERLRDRHWAGLKHYVNTGEGPIVDRRIEMPALRADGSEFPAELTVTATQIDGQPFFTGYLRDITERKQAERQLQLRIAQQAAVAELGQDALASDDLQGLLDRAVEVVAETLDNELCKVLKLLPSGEELRLEAGVGWREGLVGRGTVDTGDNSQAGHTLRSDEPVIVEDLRTETRFSGPPLLREHGVISGMSVILRGQNGEPWGVLGTHSTRLNRFTRDDVHFLQAVANILSTAIERRQWEQALRGSERRERARADELQTLMDSVPAVVLVAHDSGGRRITGSRAACELLKLPLDANLSKSAPDAERPGHFRILREGRELAVGQLPVQRAARGEEIRGEEIEIRFDDGTVIHLLGNAIPLHDEVGEVRGALAAMVDVTERKRLLEELRELNRTLEHRVAERTEQVYRQADRLRHLAAQLSQAEQRERRQIAQVLHDHLQQILVAAKMQVGQLEGAAQVTDLLEEAIGSARSLSHELYPAVLYDRGLAEALQWLGRRYRQHGLEVEVDAEPGAEPADQDLQAFLFQAVRELLLNAVKHGRADGARIRMGRREGMLRISVEDNGAGCDPEQMFHQPESGGFGLLSIQERLSMLDGSISAQTAPGRGCRVTLQLALEGAGDGGPPEEPTDDWTDRAEEQPQAVASAVGEAETAKKPSRVMLADDHKIVREGLAGILRAEPDIEPVAEASDGREAVEQIEQARPDVIVMDVSMPRMDGVEATRLILRDHPHIRVIGLSVHEREDLANAMYDAGAVAYLAKGGPATELIKAIRQHGDAQPVR